MSANRYRYYVSKPQGLKAKRPWETPARQRSEGNNLYDVEIQAPESFAKANSWLIPSLARGILEQPTSQKKSY